MEAFFTMLSVLGRDPDLRGMVVFDGEMKNIIPCSLGSLWRLFFLGYGGVFY